jgi:hypothetical protein
VTSTWVQDLHFSGDINGTMSEIAPSQPGQRSECTGRNSRVSGSWASTIFGPAGGQVWGVVALVKTYKGPGTYQGREVTLQVHSSDNSKTWTNLAGDQAILTVASNEESGTVDATLSEITVAKPQLHLTGRWSCRS